jgi:hypothetical protein
MFEEGLFNKLQHGCEVLQQQKEIMSKLHGQVRCTTT